MSSIGSERPPGPSLPRLGQSQAPAFVPLSADVRDARCGGCVRGSARTPVAPLPPPLRLLCGVSTPRPHVNPSLPSPPLRRGGDALSHNPDAHESDAAAGGRFSVPLRCPRYACALGFFLRLVRGEGAGVGRVSPSAVGGERVWLRSGAGSPVLLPPRRGTRPRRSGAGVRTMSSETPRSSGSRWATPELRLSSPSTTTSDQTRQPAEFKHITKRRKRN